MSSRVLVGWRAPGRAARRCVATVGVFDGVHVAHQALVRATVRLARHLRASSVVVTFDPDPQQVLNPAGAAPALMPLDERVRLLRTLGASRVWVIPFTRRFARMSAQRFIRRALIGRLRCAALVVGERFAFGRGRAGDVSVLRAVGRASGMRIRAIRPITRGGAAVSSSRIRALIAHGRLRQAGRLLGRAPALYGVVIRGSGRGRTLGIPTANIRLTPQALPPRGVYAALVRRRDTGRTWRGVMNLGVRPTFGPGPLVCEVHLLGFSGSLRGRPVAVSLLGRLRRERRFATPEALARQIRRDLARARGVFAALS